MQVLRLALYFLIGFGLGGYAVLSHAETIEAIPHNVGTPAQNATWQATESGLFGYASQAALCEAMAVARYGSGSVGAVLGTNGCRLYRAGNYPGGSYTDSYGVGRGPAQCPAGSTLSGGSCFTYSCEPGQNWTLNGATCTRPDCAAGETRDPATGLCSNPCIENEEVPGFYSVPWTSNMGQGGYCIDHCRVYGPSGDLVRNGVKDAGGTVTGKFYKYAETCTSSPVTPSPPATPKSDPPCAAGDGVIQYPDKTVKCVASGTPGATVPPVVKADDKKVTYPDGSTSNTTVTQTCTGQGACSTTTVTTVTGVGGVPNGPAGQAGTPGTTSGSGMSSTTGGTDQQSDFCARNPSAQICRGGMNEEETQRHILTEIYKLTDTSGEAPDLKDLGDAGKKPLSDFAAKGQDGKDELTRQEEAISDYATGKKSDPLTDEKRSAWAEAMNSGWFDEVPQSGCQATDAKIGPFTWQLDICPTAAKIADIGAYAMWFMLAVGTFVMITGGRKE